MPPMTGPSQSSIVAGKDVAWLLADRASRHPDRPFLHWEPFDGANRRWSYAAFHDDVRRAAAGLIAADVKAGDRILLHAENSPELLIAWFASALVGSVAVTTNTAASQRELDYYAAHSAATFILCDTHHLPLVCQLPNIKRIWLIGDHAPENKSSTVGAFGELLTSAPETPAPVSDWRRPLSIQFTSGSTSLPKAVLWTHGNAIWGARISAQHQRLDESDVFLVFLPFFHANAQTYSILPALWAGAQIVLQPKFSVTRFWQVSLKHAVTRTSVVPFCLRALFEHPSPERHSYRTWGLGVAHPEAEARFGVKVLGWWGMTETIAQPIVSDYCADHPFMSMGYVSPAYEIEIRTDRGIAEIGEMGDLYVRGERGVSMFLEYASNPEATAAAFTDDGWFRTGDRAHMGAHGDIYFDGRLNDIIRCGGENISAAEIEMIIASVEGVSENAVVGLPHHMLGEVPIAYVIATGKIDDLEIRILERCRELLATYKIPRVVKVVKDLPRGALNKVAKSKLAELAESSIEM